MKYIFNSKSVIEESGIRKISARAAELVAQGHKVADLSLGIPVINPDPIFADAAREAIETGKTVYPPSAGYPSLKQKFVDWHNSVYETKYISDEVLVTTGGRHGIYMLLQLFINS
jgi:aspartate aminotransferase